MSKSLSKPPTRRHSPQPSSHRAHASIRGEHRLGHARHPRIFSDQSFRCPSDDRHHDVYTLSRPYARKPKPALKTKIGAVKLSHQTHTFRPSPVASPALATRGVTAGLPKRYQTDPRRYLTWQDMTAALDAERFATQINLPLTALITITWKWLATAATRFNGERAEDWNAHHAAFVRILRKWLIRNGVPAAWLFVRERCVGRGAHTHFMVHLPPARWKKLRPSLDRYLREICCDKWGMIPTAAHVTGGKFKTPGMIYDTQRAGLVAYLAKALNPDEMVATGANIVKLPQFLGIQPEAQASVPVKRIGCTENIGPKAREDAGFDDTEDLLRLADRLRGATSNPTAMAKSTAPTAPGKSRSSRSRAGRWK